MYTKSLALIIALASTLALSAKSNPLSNSPEIARALVIQSALRQIHKEVNKTVVRIETEDSVRNPFANDPMFRFFFGVPQQRQQKRQGLGSGFIISSDGYIVTNHHVVGKARSRKKAYVDKIKVKLVNGKEYAAKVIGSDIASDIAVLKINPKETLPTVFIGDSDKVEVGDFAIAIGNPFGLHSTFTMGIISSKGQDVSQDGVPRIQTDAPINPGNSGGPLLNIKGEVIGINQMIYSRTGGSVGIGFAIPANYALTIIERLKKGQDIRHGYIGVQVIPSPTQEQLKELDINNKAGLLIGDVKIGSPAWKAGIRPYDFVTHIDGKPAKQFSTLKRAVIRKGVGRKLIVRLWRSGKSKKVTVTIGAAKS